MFNTFQFIEELLRWVDGLNCIIYEILIMMTTELIVFGIFVIVMNSASVSTYPIITHRMMSYECLHDLFTYTKSEKKVSNNSNTKE